ncbi:Glutamine-dependent NAD(+) synthetase [Streptomyces alboniger]
MVEGSADLLPVLVVGAPLRHRNGIYNCAVIVHRGRVLGVVPKSYPPNYREFYERRQITAGDDERGGTIRVGGETVPFGVDLLFEAADVPRRSCSTRRSARTCGSRCRRAPRPPWPARPSWSISRAARSRSAGPRTASCLCRSASSRCLAAYVYSAAGLGESTTTDLSWDGQTLIYENGALLAESDRFPTGDQYAVADVDLDLLRQERIRAWARSTRTDVRTPRGPGTSGRCPSNSTRRPRTWGCAAASSGSRSCPRTPTGSPWTATRRTTSRSPDCSSGSPRSAVRRVVIGVSGGLDSTHALIVAAQAMDRAGRPRSDILAFTLPGFATSDHTAAPTDGSSASPRPSWTSRRPRG